MSLTLAVLGLAVFAAVAMAVGWWLVIRTGSSGWADTFWSATVGLAGIAAALWPLGETGVRNWLVAVLVGLWSGRLALHIARRTLRGGDDPRYAELKRGWGERYKPQLFIFLEIQAAIALVLALAVMVAAHNPAPLDIGDAAGVVIALIAIAGETVSDRQLAAFGRDAANRGAVCDRGLWALSRHPNYFFEWLHWLAYCAIAMGYAWGWLSLSAPIVMYVLLRHVSGVPPLEAHMVRSRGHLYRTYQRRVPAFWPIGRLSTLHRFR
jgi:steroid 5-alpha reductase family enzyme